MKAKNAVKASICFLSIAFACANVAFADPQTSSGQCVGATAIISGTGLPAYYQGEISYPTSSGKGNFSLNCYGNNCTSQPGPQPCPTANTKGSISLYFGNNPGASFSAGASNGQVYAAQCQYSKTTKTLTCN